MSPRASSAASTVAIASHLVLSTNTYQRDDDRDVKNGNLALTGVFVAKGVSCQLPIFLNKACDTMDLPDCQRKFRHH